MRASKLPLVLLLITAGLRSALSQAVDGRPIDREERDDGTVVEAYLTKVNSSAGWSFEYEVPRKTELYADGKGTVYVARSGRTLDALSVTDGSRQFMLDFASDKAPSASAFLGFNAMVRWSGSVPSFDEDDDTLLESQQAGPRSELSQSQCVFNAINQIDDAADRSNSNLAVLLAGSKVFAVDMNELQSLMWDVTLSGSADTVAVSTPPTGRPTVFAASASSGYIAKIDADNGQMLFENLPASKSSSSAVETAFFSFDDSVSLTSSGPQFSTNVDTGLSKDGYTVDGQCLMLQPPTPQGSD